MRSITLQRRSTGDDGTFGHLSAAGLVYQTAELPWRDNARGISCIPAGHYVCRWHQSPRFGFVYRLDGTAPRSEVLIHSGNFSGDKSKGKLSDVEGCILLGIGSGTMRGQQVVLASRDALRRFNAELAQADFELVILPIVAGGNP